MEPKHAIDVFLNPDLVDRSPKDKRAKEDLSRQICRHGIGIRVIPELAAGHRVIDDPRDVVHSLRDQLLARSIERGIPAGFEDDRCSNRTYALGSEHVGQVHADRHQIPAKIAHRKRFDIADRGPDRLEQQIHSRRPMSIDGRTSDAAPLGDRVNRCSGEASLGHDLDGRLEHDRSGTFDSRINCLVHDRPSPANAPRLPTPPCARRWWRAPR